MKVGVRKPGQFVKPMILNYSDLAYHYIQIAGLAIDRIMLIGHDQETDISKIGTSIIHFIKDFAINLIKLKM